MLCVGSGLTFNLHSLGHNLLHIGRSGHPQQHQWASSQIGASFCVTGTPGNQHALVNEQTLPSVCRRPEHVHILLKHMQAHQQRRPRQPTAPLPSLEEQGLCLGATFLVAASNGRDPGRRVSVLGFCRSIDTLSEVAMLAKVKQQAEPVADLACRTSDVYKLHSYAVPTRRLLAPGCGGFSAEPRR